MTDKKIKLLVVDDMEGIREGVRFYFEEKGYAVFIAESAEQALPIIKTQCPDIMLLDMNLPGMNGIELLKSVRQFNSAIKAIMVSASRVDSQMNSQLKELNVLEFIPKPVNFDELELAIVKALNLP